jgi:hypothetical protein
MQFIDLKDSKRGAMVLLCTKQTPEEQMRAWPGTKVGNHGDRLDLMVNTDLGVIDLGYKCEEKQYGTRFELVEYRLARYVYLHSEPSDMLRPGKISKAAPLMSAAFQIGAKEIHTHVIEDEDYRKAVEAAGVKVVYLGSNNGDTPIQKPAPVTTPEPVKKDYPTKKKKPGRPKKKGK